MYFEYKKSNSKYYNKKTVTLKESSPQMENFVLQTDSSGKKIIIRNNQKIVKERPTVSERIQTNVSQHNESKMFIPSHITQMDEEIKSSDDDQSQIQLNLPYTHQFSICPSFDELSLYTDNQLSIFNQQGKIIFHGPVDLRGADLDNIFMIGEMNYSIYDNFSCFKQPYEVQYFNLDISVAYQDNEYQFLEELRAYAKKTGASLYCYSFEYRTLGLFFS